MSNNMANAHVTDYLNYYITLDNPQYAVLLIGKWGCGKTYYVNKLVDNWKKSEYFENDIVLKPIYISLNGIDEINTINNKIKSEISTFLTKAGNIAKTVLIGFIKTSFKIDLDWNNDGKNDGNVSFTPDLLDIFRSRDNHIKGQKILIFDDIERCRLETDKIFGYINNFVEHFGCKVILLADEEKIEAKYNSNQNTTNITYKDFKEKLIGQTFEIKSENTVAVGTFIEECKKINNHLDLADCKDLINDIFNASQKENLRVLRQALLDFYRLTSFIDDRFANHGRYNEFIKNLLAYFLIVYLEFKTGNEQINEFQNTLHSVLSNNKEDSTGKIAEKKYNPILKKAGIYNSLYVFSIDELICYIKKGYISKQQLNTLLESNTFFLTDKAQNWEKLWRWKTLDDKLFKELRDTVWKDFIQGNITEPLIVTHIAGTLISLIDENLLHKKKTFVVTKAKQILNRICTNDYFKSHNIYGLLTNVREYNADSSAELKEIIGYLYKKLKEGRKCIYDGYVKEIFENLQDGAVMQIYSKLTESLPDYSTQYEYSAILRPVNGKKLGQKIKTFNPKSISDFKNFIHYRYYPEERYSNGRLENYHKDDRNCLVDLKKELSKNIRKRNKIKNRAIINLVKEIDDVINKLN
jgi:hypothetical protein